MVNEVYANSLEIACKSAKGKAIACFPDVCFTPPSPPAGWIPVPYANTAYAKDTTNASKTVFIMGKPVMKKDISYFKTSTGNEPAAGPKGIVTGVKKGKAYFTSWSMNVLIEGENVDRHTDSTTHNHGSTANTANWAYTDKRANRPPNECIYDCIKIERECGTGVSKKEAEEMCRGKKAAKNKTAQKKKGAKGSRLVNSFIKKFKGKVEDSINWKMKHCGILMVKTCTSKADIEKQMKKLDNAKEEMEKLLENLPETVATVLKDSANSVSTQLAKDILVKGIVGLDFEGGLLKGIFKFFAKKIPFAGAALSAYDINKLREAAKKIVDELNKGAGEYIQEFKNKIKTAKKQLVKTKGQLQRFKDGTLKKNELLDLQEAQADLDKCLKARKCNMVPFNVSKSTAFSEKQGCCPGQTGHHLIPNSMIEYPPGEAAELGKGKIDGCPKYKYKDAPTVCVEGKDQNECLHKKIHDVTSDKLTETYTKPKGQNKIELGKATNIVSGAHKKVFSKSECNSSSKKGKGPGCLDKQLELYFKKACGKNWKEKYGRTVDGRSSAKH